MQNKGAIRLFAIALALVSIYQLSFTLITGWVRKDAKEYANGVSKKEEFYTDSISGEGVYNFLWLRNYTYRECQDREINLGLDLQGGMNLILEVSVVDVVKSLANNSQDPAFLKALQKARELEKNSQEGFVALFGKAFTDADPGAKLSSIFSTRELKDRINFETSNDEVLKVIEKEVQDAIDNSFNILTNRIDRFGVTSPNIQRLQTQGQILIDLPGVKEPERVRKLLQGSAKLEFWETYENPEIFEYLRTANTRITEMLESDAKLKKDTNLSANEVVEPAKEKPADALDSLAKGIVKTESKDTTITKEKSALDSLKAAVAKDTSSTKNQSFEDFQKKNPLFAILRPATDQQGQLQKGASVGICHLKDTALVNKYLNDPRIKALFPRDLKLLWTLKPVEYIKDQSYFQLVAIKITNREGLPALPGDVVTSARADFGQNQSAAEVSMAMNAEGAKIWARVTKDNIGRQVAIVLDNIVYSFPVVQSEITGGHSQITGNFTIAEAKDLANVLKSGKMPASARIIQEELIGPTLGKESINKSMISFLIASILIIVYMMLYYNKAGAIANIALLANVLFIFGVLASLGTVLTLSGIAGLVLTVGMSVDANVLIYERVREELRLGKGIRLALSDGFTHAMSAIIDSNVTTLLSAIILGYFGKGPIQGFAIVLGIGILTSMFSAIFITRMIFEWLLDKNKALTFGNKITNNAFKNVNIDFIGSRKIWYAISGLVIIIGIVSLLTRGLSMGIDFKGGRTYTVRFDKVIPTVDIAEALLPVFVAAPEVKTFGEANQVKITTAYRIDDPDSEADKDAESKLYQGLKKFLPENVTEETFLNTYRLSSQKVGPTIADDIKVGAMIALVLSLIVQFAYIFLRFNNWRYGLGAVAALIHDSMFILTVFSLFYGVLPFSLDIDQAFIAAILTVIGYSMNDTVIIFDRIREYLRMKKRFGDAKTTLNLALNSTLSRTINTSFTIFLVLIAIFLFGGEVIRGFVFAMLIGIIVGTYSSIFVATAIVYDTDKSLGKISQDEQDALDKAEAKKAKRLSTI